MLRTMAIIFGETKLLRLCRSPAHSNRLRLSVSTSQSNRLSSTSPPSTKQTISVCTFNLLAPCYKRLSSESDRESAYDTMWQTRHLSIVQLLQSLNIDLICLQEFWMANPFFAQLYRSNLSSKYAFYTLQRTGALEDGLAILVDTTRFQLVDKCEWKLHDLGHRVGLLLHLKFEGKDFLLLNLHLTFPHRRFESRLRLKQIKKFLDLLTEYRRAKNLLDQCSVLICGDFNSSYYNDSVYQLIEKNRFQSSFQSIHGFEPNVTHLTHRKEQLGVDFIFYQSDVLRPVHSELIPRGCNHLIWHDDSGWKLSDHRAILTTFQSIDS